jgi:hypothetical protein
MEASLTERWVAVAAVEAMEPSRHLRWIRSTVTSLSIQSRYFRRPFSSRGRGVDFGQGRQQIRFKIFGRERIFDRGQ